MAFTLQIGDISPDFNLKSTNGKFYSLKDFKEDVLIVFFTCNHCPYVIGSDEKIRELVLKYDLSMVRFVGINSNSKNTYEEDSFENMVSRMEQFNFPWLYLHDETQQIAKDYGALKTPHYFVFDTQRKLMYTGRAFDNPRDTIKATTNELENAIDQLIAQKSVELKVTNPIGCNVKWDGKDKHWMPAEACDLI